MKNQSFYLLAGAAALVSMNPGTAAAQPKPPPAGHAISSNQAIDREYNSKIRLNAPAREVASMTAATAAAKCVVKSAKGKAGDLVGGPMTDDPKFKRLSRGLFGRYRACAPTTEGVPLILISGALAEELVRLKQPALQPRSAPADSASAKAFYATSGGITIDSLGRCLAVYSPGLAYRVLFTGAGTAGENEALGQLYAQTPECGVRATPKDIPMSEQRTAVATGLYYWLQKS
jgi:hypothetical protein